MTYCARRAPRVAAETAKSQSRSVISNHEACRVSAWTEGRPLGGNRTLSVGQFSSEARRG